jgi:hypothetical protein
MNEQGMIELEMARVAGGIGNPEWKWEEGSMSVA